MPLLQQPPATRPFTELRFDDLALDRAQTLKACASTEKEESIWMTCE